MDLQPRKSCCKTDTPRTLDILKAPFDLETHEAVASMNSLINLGFLNHTWISLFKFPKSALEFDNHKKEEKHARVCLCLVSHEENAWNDDDLKIENGFLYISEEAAFNILISDISTFNKFQAGEGVKVFFSQIKDAFYEPAIASKCVICPIRSPVLDEIEATYDTLLLKNFKKRKLLYEDQILGVCCNLNNYFEESSKFVWFRVLELQTDGKKSCSAWVEDGVSALFLQGSENSHVPYDTKHSCKFHFFSSALKAGMKSQFIELTNLLQPVFHGDIPASDTPILLYGPPASGKQILSELLCNFFKAHFYSVNCHLLLGDSLAAVEQRIQGIFSKAAYFSPCLLLLCHVHALNKGDDDEEGEPRLVRCLQRCLKSVSTSKKVVVIATTNCYEQMSPMISRLFTYEIQIKPFDEGMRHDVIKALLPVNSRSHVSVDSICKRTAGMVLGDFCTLVYQAINNSTAHIRDGSTRSTYELRNEDFDEALGKIQSEYKDTLGTPDVPQVYWGDIGGLAVVKEEILETIRLPLQYPELMSKGLRRSGILLYGPPGCGKTLLAKAVATEFSLNFFSVKGPELMNMYVGQSEQNVRDMFQKARESAPCIIFFDELDSIAPNRGRSGDSGGVMDRIVSQLLAELDGLQVSNELFVIGATNRPDLLDKSLLRPGRFDKMVYVGFPETKEDRLNVIKSYTDKMQLCHDVDLDKIEHALPLYLTGADFYALCADAFLNGIKRCIEVENCQNGEGDGILIKMCDFQCAIKGLVPSVSTDDVLKYKDIKRKLENESTQRT